MSNSNSDSETVSLLDNMSNSNPETASLDHSGRKTKDDELVVKELYQVYLQFIILISVGVFLVYFWYIYF